MGIAKVELSNLRQRAVNINRYIDSIPSPFKEKFLEHKKVYKIKTDVIEKLKPLAEDYVIVVFSAEWCKDCAANIPILALISEATGLEVMVFGGLKRDPLNPNRKWSVPPSPPEVEIFHVDKIPYILVLSAEGEKIGEIIENPRKGLTLEEEIFEIISGKGRAGRD